MRAFHGFYAALALALPNVACRPVGSLALDVPPEVRAVALIAAGSSPRATPLMPWSEGEPLLVFADPMVETELLGFSAFPSGAGTAPIAAAACGPLLPAPVFAATLLHGQASPFAAPSLALTDPGLAPPGVCPELPSTPITVDPSCAGKPHCLVDVRKKATCDFEIDLGACGPGLVSATVHADGSRCLDPSGATWNCTAPTSTGSQNLLVCTTPEGNGCEMPVYFDPREPPPPFVIDRRPLFAETAPPLFVPAFSRQHLEVRAADLFGAGYAFDLAALSDRVLVSAGDGQPVEDCRGTGDGGRLLAFDLETLAPISSATAPPCLFALLPDPSGSGAVGSFIDRATDAWTIGRFDDTGRLVASVALEPNGPNEPSASWDGQVMAMLADPPRIVTVLGNHAGGLGMKLYFHQPSLGAIDLIRLDSTRKAWSIAEETTGGRLVLTTTDGELNYLSLGSHQIEEHLQLPIEAGGAIFSTTVFGGALFAGGNGAIFSRSGNVALEHPTFEGAPVLAPLLRFPANAARLLAGGTIIPERQGARTAVVARFDTDRKRFLHGLTEVGGGVVSRLVEDCRGRVWALLPWAGELLRLTPR